MPIEDNFSSSVLPSRDHVLTEVKQLVAECESLSPDTLRENTNLDNDLHFDSLERVELAMELEEHFDITIPDEIEQEIRTIGDIVDGVMRILSHSQP
jgi:acyl carrier protein